MRSMTSPTLLPDPKGTAALGICESLLLALVDLEVMTEKDVQDVLTDVAETHLKAANQSPVPHHHLAVVDVIKTLLKGKSEPAN